MMVYRQRHYFEGGLKLLVAFGFGMGAASVMYDVPDLKAHAEFLHKVVHGDYPGIALTAGDSCTPLRLQNPGDASVE